MMMYCHSRAVAVVPLLYSQGCLRSPYEERMYEYCIM